MEWRITFAPCFNRTVTATSWAWPAAQTNGVPESLSKSGLTPLDSKCSSKSVSPGTKTTDHNKISKHMTRETNLTTQYFF